MEIIINQILMMAILMAFGYALRKLGYFDDVVTKELSRFLLRIIIPLTIIESFIVPFEMRIIKNMFLMGTISIVLHFILILLAKVFYKEDQGLEKYATIFTNKGFIGIPIFRALYGNEAIALLTPLNVISQTFIWTYGVNLVSGEKEPITFKQIITNPSFIGLFIGLVFLLLPIDNYPESLLRAISSLNSVNTPLAMIVLGVYLANIDMKDMIYETKSYYVSFIRLLVIPIITIFVMKYIPVDDLVKYVVIISMAVPAASNTAMFADLYDKDPGYGAQLVSKTTILSAFSLPFILWLMDVILWN